MHRIVVLGSANGSRNLGDECMWESLVDYLRNQFPGVEVVTDALSGWVPPFDSVSVLPMLSTEMKFDSTKSSILSKLSNWGIFGRAFSRIGRNPRVNALVVDRLARGPQTELERAWYAEIQNSDALFISGAGGMTDQYSVHGIFSWWLLAGWAKSLGKPVFAVGQGVGPIKDKALLEPLKSLLESCDYLGVREEKSFDFVNRLLRSSETKVDLTLDWALGINVQREDLEVARQLTQDQFGSTPYITLSMHLHQPLALRRRKALVKVTHSLVQTAASMGYKVLFIPNMTGEGHSDDRKLADYLIGKLPPSLQTKCAVHRSQSDARVVRALLKGSEGLFATRYHPLVFALTENTPTIGMYFDEYYEQKLSGASAQFGVAGNTAPIDQVISDPVSAFSKLRTQQIVPITQQQIAKNLLDPLKRAMTSIK